MIVWLLTLDEAVLARFAYACFDARDRYLLPSKAGLDCDAASKKAVELYNAFVNDDDALTKLLDNSSNVTSNFLKGLRLLSKLELFQDASPIYLNLRHAVPSH